MKINKEELINLQKNSNEVSYKELTTLLNIPYYRGCQKDSQLKELSRICKYKKNGTKYKILEIYDTHLMIKDDRTTTMPSIEFILLNELSKAEINGTLFASNKELLKLCYIINNNYYSILSNKDKNSLIISDKYEFGESFIEYVDKAYDTLKPSLLSALKSMVNRKEISLSIGFKVQRREFDNFICVTETEPLGAELFRVQGDVMKEMGIVKQSDLFGKYAYKRKEYYDTCNSVIKNKSKYDSNWVDNGWNFTKFYQCHAIILNQNKMEYDLQMCSQIKKELNNLMKNKVHTTKRLHDMTYNDIDKWFEICNTVDGDKKYQFSEDIREYYRNKDLH